MLYPKMTACHFLLIINEECVNFKNECHILILRPGIILHTNFQLYTTSFDTKVSSCHIFVNLMNNWWGLRQFSKWMPYLNSASHNYHLHQFSALHGHVKYQNDSMSLSINNYPYGHCDVMLGVMNFELWILRAIFALLYVIWSYV